jgi:hypothetical protein
MDILEIKQKNEFDYDLKDIIKILKFKNSPIELKGSSSLKSQKYYSDYDLFTEINYNYSVEEIYDEFHKILNNIISSYDLYFVEFKLQTIKGKKYRWFPDENFEYNNFKKKFKEIDFSKIDIVARNQNIFIEVSCIYKFSQSKLTKEEYILSINKDIKELKKEKKYYKILKRMYSIYKIENNLHKIKILNNIFNGDMGKMYKTISNLEAIKTVKKYYNDADTKKKIEINLSDIKEPLSEPLFNDKLNKYKTELNKKAKKIYDDLI